jgi:hypothetical protein
MLIRNRNLDYLQLRCSKLENLIRTLYPSIDLDAHLSPGAPSVSLAASDPGQKNAPERSDEEEEEVETVPESARGFEWHEGSEVEITNEIAGLSDGMVALNVDSRDMGYLGMLLYTHITNA